MSAETVDIRLGRLEGTCEQIGHRVDSVDRRLSAVEHKLDTTRDMLLARMEQRFAQFDRRFVVLYGLVALSIILPLVSRLLVR